MVNMVTITLPLDDAFAAVVSGLKRFHLRVTSKNAYLYINIRYKQIGVPIFKVYEIEGAEDFLTIFTDDGAGKCYHCDEIASSYNFNPPAFANKTMINRLSETLCSIIQFINTHKEDPNLYDKEGQIITDFPKELLLFSSERTGMVAFDKSPSSVPPTDDQFSRIYTDRRLRECCYARSYPQGYKPMWTDEEVQRNNGIVSQFTRRWP